MSGHRLVHRAPMDNGVEYREMLLPSFAGGCAAGAAFGIFDAALLEMRNLADVGVFDHGRVVLAGLLAGLLGGFVASFVVSPVAAVLRHKGAAKSRSARFRAILSGASCLLSVLFCVADAMLFTHYREAHLWLGIGALGAAVFGGALVFPRRWAPVTAILAVLLALFASWGGHIALGGQQRLWHLVQAHATITGRAALYVWQEPERPQQQSQCQLPPPAPVSVVGGAEGSHVLLLTVDAIRGDLGGEDLSTTLPQITSMLPDAFRFDRAYAAAAQSSWSDTATLWGRWPHRLQLVSTAINEQDQFFPLPDDHPLLLDPTSWAQRPYLPVTERSPNLITVLGAAGFLTHTVVPWVFFLRGGGITAAFDVVDDRPYQEHNRDLRGVTSGPLADRAIDALRDVPDERNWLMWIHFLDPHAPYVAFGDVAEDAPPRQRYLSEIRRVDHHAGRLLRALDEMGELDRTVVVVWSDHGEEFRDHGGRFHGTSAYDEMVRVPMLIHVPGVQGRPLAETVSLVDLAPTILDILGVESEVAFDGQSLWPLMQGRPWRARPILTFGTRGGVRAAVVDGTLKLIEDVDAGTLQLYDLNTDPSERHNLVDARPEDVARLRCLLLAAGVVGERPFRIP